MHNMQDVIWHTAGFSTCIIHRMSSGILLDFPLLLHFHMDKPVAAIFNFFFLKLSQSEDGKEEEEKKEKGKRRKKKKEA